MACRGGIYGKYLSVGRAADAGMCPACALYSRSHIQKEGCDGTSAAGLYQRNCHEMKTPLAVIRGFAENLEEKYKRREEKILSGTDSSTDGTDGRYGKGDGIYLQNGFERIQTCKGTDICQEVD